MFTKDGIYMGLSEGERIYMNLAMSNRHGLIAGASGTGKTITMKVMAESFSDAGVPVFMCDVKGDVSGMAAAGEKTDGMEKRIDKFGIRDSFTYRAFPTTFWDIYGKRGHSVKATISDMGPNLLSRILGLSEAQEGVLNIIFKIADDKDMLLYDLKDLKALIEYVDLHMGDFTTTYGNVTKQSLGTLVRALIPLEEQGGDLFFGEPMLDINDLIRTDANGKGIINILDSQELIQSPKLYASFVLWMMAELFENLPEVGDLAKPKLIFFFDEAHFLFSDAPDVMLQKIEQVVKLIRSKGVGIYFVTQSPSDIPDSVLAQLSNRVQHALRAYTPKEQKAVKVAAQTFRSNPKFKTEDAIMELGTGEALVSFLDADGAPQIVERASIICPASKMAPAPLENIMAAISQSPMKKYDTTIDSESAYEMLAKEKVKLAEEMRLAEERAQFEKEKAEFEKQQLKDAEKEAKKAEREEERKKLVEERKAERRKSRIESEIIRTGTQILKRGLLGILKRR